MPVYDLTGRDPAPDDDGLIESSGSAIVQIDPGPDVVSVLDESGTTVVQITDADVPVIYVSEPVTFSPTLTGGGANVLRATATAAHALSGHRLVTPAPDGRVRYASADEIADEHAPLWLTLGAADADAGVDVQMIGAVTEPSWSWTVGPLYLGLDGQLTQVAPAAPGAVFCAQVGYAYAPTTVYLDRRASIELI
jgi:hypothetical protein